MQPHLKKIGQQILQLLDTQQFAVLATAGATEPHASIISIAYTDNGSCILFLTPMQTRKYQNIKRNPNVSLVIDARPASSAAIQKSCALTIRGKARDVLEKDRKRFMAAFIGRHPSLKTVSADPAYALIAVKVRNYAFTSSLHRVTNIHPKALMA